MARKLYDLKKNPITVHDIPIDQVVSIKASFKEDQRGTTAGINGARNEKYNNRTGDVELVVTQHSNSHALLAALDKQEISYMIKQIDKTSLATSPAGFLADGCVLTKPPDYDRQAESQDVTYNFSCIQLILNHSGAGTA